MRAYLIYTLLAPFFALGAAAQAAVGAPSAVQTDFSGEAVLLLSAGDDDGNGAAPRPQRALWELSVSGGASTVLADGTELGVRAALRGQKDHPARPGFAGRAPFRGAGASWLAPFPGLGAAADTVTTTTAEQPRLADAGPRGSVEAAYVYAEGGYGELVAGRDLGIAARFHEGAPSAFTHARSDAPLLDPAGLAGVYTRHDITGPSAKLSYATPRLLGVRAGVSYTPNADAKGLDRNPEAAGVPGPSPSIEDVTEGAVSLVRDVTVDGSRVRVRASLSGSVAGVTLPTVIPSNTPADAPTARTPAPVPGERLSGRMETVAAGFEAATGPVTAGASLIRVNAPGGMDYSAWSAGLSADAFGGTLAASFGAAEGESFGADAFEAVSFDIGYSREIGEDWRVAAGYVRHELSQAGAGAGQQAVSTGRGVVEITRYF